MTIIINSPGTYYQSNDITVPNGSDPGSYIRAPFVRLILSARIECAGGPGSTNAGILIDPGCYEVSIVGMGGRIYNFGMGVQGARCDALRVRGLNIEACYFRGIQAVGDNMMIRDNDVRGVGGSSWGAHPQMIGIEVTGSSNGDVNVIGNRVSNCFPPAPSLQEGCGISLSGFGVYSRICDNLVHNAYQAPLRSDGEVSTFGIWTDPGDDVKITGNTFENFGVGIAFPTGAKGHVDRNTFIGVTYPISASDDGDVVQGANSIL